MAPVSTEFMERLTSLADEADRRLKANRALVAETDRAVSLLYHEIESQSFDIMDGYLLALRLQGVLATRRAVKNDGALLQTLADQLASLCRRAERKLAGGAGPAALAAEPLPSCSTFASDGKPAATFAVRPEEPKAPTAAPAPGCGPSGHSPEESSVDRGWRNQSGYCGTVSK